MDEETPKPQCMKCGKPPAWVITKIVKDEVYDIFLCEEHAAQYSPLLQNAPQASILKIIHKILGQPSGQTEGGAEGAGGDAGPMCANCGLHYGAYRKTLLLGCSDCYQAFGELLLKDLRKIHGAVQQPAVGVPPRVKVQFTPEPPLAKPPDPKTPDLQTSIANLRGQMAEAIENENFERAAQLRDLVRGLEAGGRESAAKPDA